MSNYWSEFSIAFVLPKEAIDYAMQLHAKLKDDEVEREKLFDEDYCNDFECKEEVAGSLWLWQANGESCGVNDAIKFIQHLLTKFDPDGVVTMQWSNCCGKPRLDAFGGGAAIIKASEVKSLNSAEWIEQQLGTTESRNVK